MALPGVSAEVLALLTVGLRANGFPCEVATSPTSGAPRLHGGEVAGATEVFGHEANLLTTRLGYLVTSATPRWTFAAR